MIKKLFFLIQLVSLICCIGSPDTELNSESEFINSLYRNDYDEALKLLKRDADPDTLDSAGIPALIISVDTGNMDLVNLLIEYNADLDIQDPEGYTPLMHSCLSGSYEIAELLITSGADLNIINKEGNSAYIIATAKGYEEITVLLDESGAVNLNEKLLEACFLGNLEEVSRLIDAGADVNAADPSGETALMRAVNYGYLDIVNLLIENGADLNAIYPELGDTVIMNAVYKEFYEITELLLKSGADPDKKNFNGDNALIWAERIDNTEIIDLLIRYGADMQILLNSKLVNYCISGYLDGIKNMLETGADINYTDDVTGWSPLMYAVNEGYRNIVQYLISAGADLNIKGRKGMDALSIAEEKDFLSISSLIMDALN